MTQCFCVDCSEEPQKSYTERHRHNCECKYIAKLFYRDAQGFEEHMKGVEGKRGKVAANRLRTGVIFLWRNGDGSSKA